MSRRGAALLILPLLLLIVAACGESVEGPEADVPEFIEAEAVAVVQTWLGLRQTSSRLDCLTTHLQFPFSEGPFQATYQGNGSWTVTHLTNNGEYAWSVFERSGAVGVLKQPSPLC